jgi:uncharacterized membrane protein YagU involved in acid resistance
MNKSKALTYQATIGDAAVDGLLGGLIAGLGMAGYLVIAGLAASESPAQVLGRFAPGAETAALTGGLMHLAVAAVYGMLFALGWWLLVRWRDVSAWPVGLIYGVTLWLIAEAIILPSTGSPLAEIPPVHFALAHGIYGVILGFVVGDNANETA